MFFSNENKIEIQDNNKITIKKAATTTTVYVVRAASTTVKQLQVNQYIGKRRRRKTRKKVNWKSAEGQRQSQ